jgi:hypothetical protein
MSKIKIVLLITIYTIIMSGCTSQLINSDQKKITEQKLQSNFRKEGISFEWTIRGELKSLEVAGYAAAMGNSEMQQETAFEIAELDAKAKLQRFLSQEIKTSRVTSTFSKNIEKANDKIKSSTNSTNETIAISDIESNNSSPRNSSSSERENANDVTRSLVRKISEEAAGILNGVFIKNTEIMGDGKTVKVVIRWDPESQRASEELRRRFK